ncbi:MAG: ATP synthase F0 subunit B [Desulfobacteraceae bacterium]|nr:ATP synthase F0 subunit B [Desulfobacteraceae bacterium]
MLFVNFAILVFLFLKFAKKPLIGYLRGVRDKIKNELDTINGRFNDVKSTLDEEANKLKDIDQRIKEIQENAREIAKREKDKIIEDAKIAAEKMIENAKRYHNYRMALAKKALSDEMVDVAISMVEEKLTKKISEEDNEKLINKFFTDLQTLKLNLN